ncbi:hypothetical protein chiPu_0000707 [Chiloscyllium punctatum]|uniref:Uncharacterized protein n=1 Tax=Chiloscyllium punctatum TaxID=137246 RepID=A0A401RW20_CHIPU|nr:hypothetical protein [Chiloscyllium punctatum]
MPVPRATVGRLVLAALKTSNGVPSGNRLRVVFSRCILRSCSPAAQPALQASAAPLPRAPGMGRMRLPLRSGPCD